MPRKPRMTAPVLTLMQQQHFVIFYHFSFVSWLRKKSDLLGLTSVRQGGKSFVSLIALFSGNTLIKNWRIFEFHHYRFEKCSVTPKREQNEKNFFKNEQICAVSASGYTMFVCFLLQAPFLFNFFYRKDSSQIKVRNFLNGMTFISQLVAKL
jgi:hypothetical protein